MTGVVKMYTDRHGYGFIVGDDGQSYFAHISNVKKRPGTVAWTNGEL